MEQFYINRRNFLKTSSAALAMSYFGLNGMDILNSFKSLRVGLIGAGWYGKSDVLRLIQVSPVEVVSICDVDKNMLEEAANLISQRQKSGKKPRLFTDYQKMLAEKDLDIVLIGSPDHWHALQAIEAIHSGAHVYLQKPISLDVLEGESILKEARKFNRTVQIGTQRRSTPHLVDAKKNIVDEGLLGKVAHVEICCYYHMRFNDNPPIMEVPEYFDYDFWCGPAPMRGFDGLPHRRWRAYMEYGNGIVGDMCVHMLDTVRWMLDLKWPKKISSEGGIYVQKQSNSNITDTQTAVFEFDELNVVWQHRTWGDAPDPEYPWALKIFGENGTLKADVHKFEFTPRNGSNPIKQQVLFEKEEFPEDVTEKGIEIHVAPATRRHMLNFLSSIQDGTKPVADIEEGHISTTSCILANLALIADRPLIYDPISKTIVNDSESTALLKRPYRGDWKHPSYLL